MGVLTYDISDIDKTLAVFWHAPGRVSPTEDTWNIRLYDEEQNVADMLKDLSQDAIGPNVEFVDITLDSGLRASGRISCGLEANLEIHVNRVC